MGAALTNRRALGPAEAGLLAKMSIVSIALGVVAAVWPTFLAWPAAVILAWVGVAWLGKAWSLKHATSEPPRDSGEEVDAEDFGKAVGSTGVTGGTPPPEAAHTSRTERSEAAGPVIDADQRRLL